MEIASFFASPWTWISIAGSAVFVAYRYSASKLNYFRDHGIPGPKPIMFFGNMWGLWKKDMAAEDLKNVKKYGKVYGYYEGWNPTLYVADADLLRSICLKDFDHFVDHKAFITHSRGIRKWLTALEGQEWKDVRSSVSPVFTTGKIKQMSVLINDCVAKLSDKLRKIAENEGKIEAHVIFGCFTMDVIARCAFGLTIDSLGNKDDPFVQNAQLVFHAPANKSPFILLPHMYPHFFSKLFDLLLVTKELKFFIDLMDRILFDRSRSNQKYNDFIEMATEAISHYTKEVDGKTVPKWTKEEVEEIVVGQSTLFMLAGYDTTAKTLTHMCYFLAKYPEVQQKLYDSIMEKISDNEEVSHEKVQDLPYVDQVINETLRICPPAVKTERVCTKDITYGKIHIKKGMIVNMPIYAIHHMEEYYPEPEKFDPERWSPANKANRNQYTFLPFGLGPRICIGMRFAQEELKIALCSLVRQFRFFPVDETPENLEFDTGMQFILQPLNTTVGIELRGNSS